MRPIPNLKPLHPDATLSQPKLAQFDHNTTQALINSLRPGERGSLKVRPDGTILDGHHRICILRGRGVDVDSLPRDVVEPSGLTD